MILPDVNVLIYAFRKDVPLHHISNSWFNAVIAAEPRFGISPLALSALVRVTTDRRIYAVPSEVSEAFVFCDYILSRPNCEIIEPGNQHWAIFRRLCVETDTTGRRVTDAWYAALAIEWDCEWITFDRDFARFPGLRWKVPSAA